MCARARMCNKGDNCLSSSNRYLQRQTEPGMTLPINRFDCAHVVCFPFCCPLCQCPKCLHVVLPLCPEISNFGIIPQGMALKAQLNLQKYF